MPDDVMTNSEADDEVDVSDVWKQLQQTQDPTDREFLLVRLAEFAVRDHDFSDLRVSEEVHEQFASMRRAQDAYHLAGVQVGRFVAHLMRAKPFIGN